MAFRVVRRRTASALAAAKSVSGSSMVVFIWVSVWVYGVASGSPERGLYTPAIPSIIDPAIERRESSPAIHAEEVWNF
jgi:hypothetical protein